MKNSNLIDLSKKFLAEILQENTDIDKVNQYLIEGADINYQAEQDGYTALMLAVDKDDEFLVTCLLQKGANPLLQNHHKEIASELALSHSPIYQTLKNYELLFATVNNDIAGVKSALAAGANVNFQGQGGYTAIMIAVEESHLELVELLVVSGSDLSLCNNKNWDVYDLVGSNQFIYHTLRAGQPLREDTKRRLLGLDNDDERWEKGRLKTLAARGGKPFDLSQLRMNPLDGFFKPAPSDIQLAEIEKHFGHPLPAVLKEIFAHYNGCRPMLDCYGEDEDSSINYFYFLDKNRDSIGGNIWWSINTYSQYLGSETLPFAEDSDGGVFFLKWVEGQAQVWLFQYGDQPFDYDFDDDDDYKIPTCSSFIFNSLDEFLEALYEAD